MESGTSDITKGNLELIFYTFRAPFKKKKKSGAISPPNNYPGSIPSILLCDWGPIQKSLICI